MDIEAFREQLVIWGITPNVLVAIGIASLVTLFFSLRIITKWFFGIQRLQDDVTIMRKQLSDIQLQISMSSMTLKKGLDEGDAGSAKTKAKTDKSSDSFRLTNH